MIGGLARFAWRDSRTARRRLLLYMSSISFGVAALVAIDSFAENVTTSVRDQSRALLGGDVAISSVAPLPDSTTALLDSLTGAGWRVADRATFASMAFLPRTGLTRLASIHATGAGYPLYGDIVTEPRDRWQRIQEERAVLLDPGLLAALAADVGDTLTLGLGRFVIAGTIVDMPGDVGITTAVAPRVFVADRFIPETGLIAFGARVQYRTVLALPEEITIGRFVARFHKRLDTEGVRVRTYQDTEERVSTATDRLSMFLGLAGLVALLLGGIGVASGIHAYVMRKIDTVAILRCLGASGRQVMSIYVVQAAAMGAIGAVAGALMGVGVQYALPFLLADFMRVNVDVSIAPRPIALGLFTGLWVALTFSLRPLVALRHVSPLQALRREPDAAAARRARRDPVRWLIAAAIAGSVIALALGRAPTAIKGLGYAVGIGGAVAVMWGTAALVSSLARRLARPGWPFVLRQGLAALHRPGNQTRSVAIALGFGVFLIGTLYQMQSTLLARFDRRTLDARANVIFFDIQPDQRSGLDSLLRSRGHEPLLEVPIVAMRIQAINGQTLQEIAADTSQRRRAGWALNREYRSTYRAALAESERVVAGEWFAGRAEPASLPEVSLETDLAGDLGVSLGDTITWNVHGRSVPVRITSFRSVEWEGFEPNFFAVFEPRALATAPQQFVMLAQVDSAPDVIRLQSAVVSSFPGISSIDLSLVRRTITQVLDKVTTAIQSLALLSLALGIPVLFSAVAATRRDRLREGVLLKTLGATRRQIGRILLAEYALLGLVGSVTGVILSVAAAWGLSRMVFREPFVPALMPALLIALAMSALAVAIGLLTSREVFAETPMAALREN